MAKMRYIECLEFEICDKRIERKKRRRGKQNSKHFLWLFRGYGWEWKKSEFLFASANFNQILLDCCLTHLMEVCSSRIQMVAVFQIWKVACSRFTITQLKFQKNILDCVTLKYHGCNRSNSLSVAYIICHFNHNFSESSFFAMVQI